MPDDGAIMSIRRGMSWMGELSRGDKGPHASVANTMIVFGHDPELVGVVAYDDFSHSVVMTQPPPLPYPGARPAAGSYPRAINENDITLMQGYVQRTYDMRISPQIAQQAAMQAAEANRIHPVRDWLAKLEWDEKPRLATWMKIAFGAPDDAYHRAVGIKALVAAVRRVRNPGCKFDYVLVLHGLQGRQKSTAIAALFGQQWFTDNLPHDLANKDAQQGMAGKWGIELGELNVLVKSTNQAAKAFFSRQVDYYRPPYGKVFVERARQCVFIGTTNEDDFLTDTTGNRRYWPVHCVKPAEAAWIAENREQLWAEASRLESEGETLWLDEAPVQRRAEAQQLDRTAEDVWAPRIITWLTETEPPRTVVHVAEVMHSALNIPPVQQTRAGEMRVTGVLKAIGWMRHQNKVDGRNQTRWFAPGQELPGRPGTFVPTVQTSEDET